MCLIRNVTIEFSFQEAAPRTTACATTKPARVAVRAQASSRTAPLQDTGMHQRCNRTFPFRWANQNDGRPVRRTCFVECSPNTPRWQFRVTCTADTRYVNEWRHAASRDVTIARRAASGTRKTSASLERRCKRQSVTVHVLRRVTLQREQLRPCRTSICNLYQLFPVISYTLY